VDDDEPSSEVEATFSFAMRNQGVIPPRAVDCPTCEAKPDEECRRLADGRPMGNRRHPKRLRRQIEGAIARADALVEEFRE
jgi:hypothetical protein